MTIGDKIKQQRKEKGMTQKQLADKLNTSQQNLAQYENGKRNPKIETLEKIATALDISINTLTNIETVVFGNDVFIGTPETCKEFEFIAKLKNSKQGQMLDLFEELNDLGKNKALEQMEMLTKIPEYRKSDHIALHAAHEDNPTPEQEAAANRIMQDDSEWE